MSEVSDKQLEANRANAKLGGVKTEEGKNVSKYNAAKHKILTCQLTDKESEAADYLREQLRKIYQTDDIVGEMLVERVAVWWVRLQRAVSAETEQIKKIYNPKVTKSKYPLDLDLGVEVIKEGYTPKVSNEDIELLANTYLRYETTTERQFYKALRELEKYRQSKG